MTARTLIVVPTCNERANIAELSGKIFARAARSRQGFTTRTEQRRASKFGRREIYLGAINLLRLRCSRD